METWSAITLKRIGQKEEQMSLPEYCPYCSRARSEIEARNRGYWQHQSFAAHVRECLERNINNTPYADDAYTGGL